MPSQRLQDIVAATTHALAHDDLVGARGKVEQLREGLEAASAAELQALRDSVAEWLGHAGRLRAEYAGDLRDMLRRRQNVTAYHAVSGPKAR